jgi:Na+-driven multidrug efflux pump
MGSSLANFPFNALILLFGTEANAAYHIGRRIYQQLTGPVYRSISTVSSIIVGQTLGEGNLRDARYSTMALFIFSVSVLSAIGVGLFVGAEQVVRVFTDDEVTISFAIQFTRTFAILLVFMGMFFPLAGALRGAGDTRTPFYARLVGVFVFMLGSSYLLGIVLEYGLVGIYVGIFLSYVCWVVIVAIGFIWGDWQDLATSMMEERAESER